MATGGFTFAKLAICFSVLVVIGLLGWTLGLIYHEEERFLDNPLVSPESVTEESLNKCMQNCTNCIKGNPRSLPGNSREQDVCRESCVCCEKYQRCLDAGGSVESCVENLKECKVSPPPAPNPFPGPGLFPICDLVGRHIGNVAVSLIQACKDMGVQVTVPATGGCCRNATNTCLDFFTSFECPVFLTSGIYGGDGTTCPTAPCT